MIKYFIKKEFFLLGIIFIVFIDAFFYGSRLGLLFSLYIFLNLNRISKTINIFDKNVVLLFLFVFFYSLMASLRLDNPRQDGVLALVSDILVPPSIYIVGRYIISKYKNFNVFLFLIFFIGVAYSFIPIISIIQQINTTGFEGSRNLYLIWNKNAEISATGLGSHFIFNISTIGLLYAQKRNRLEKRINILFLFLFIVSLICVLRIGSRTQLLFALISLLLSFLLNTKKQSITKNMVFLFTVFLTLFFLYSKLDLDSDYLKFYADRMDSDDAGISSAGGRSDRWLGSLESIITDPFGWEFDRYGHAHNFWLDVARVSGIIPLFFLLIFTFSSFKIWINSLKILKASRFIYTYAFIIYIVFLLQFFVEPVMEGMYLFKAFY
jgi:hypothetical protein